MRKARQRLRAHGVELFFRQVQEFEHLRGSAQSLNKQLINSANALDRLISLEQSKTEASQEANRHPLRVPFATPQENTPGPDTNAHHLPSPPRSPHPTNT